MLVNNPEATKEVKERFDAHLTRLRQELERVSSMGCELIQRAEAHCHEFRIATGELYTFELLGPEIGGWPRGRLVRELPKGRKELYRFGFDASGALIYSNDHYLERLGAITVALDGMIYRIDTPQGRVRATGTNLEHAGGRDEIRVMLERRWRVTEYRGIDRRYTRVIDTGSSGDQQVFDVEYDDGGMMIRIRDADTGYVEWERKSARAKTKRPSLRELKEALLARIGERVPRACGEREVYAVVLAYSGSGETPPIPPELAVGFVEERDLLLAQDPRHGLWSIWDPRQMFGPLRKEDEPALILDDADLLAAANELGFGDEEQLQKGIAVLVQIAKALNTSALEGVRTSSDFVVYAADLDRGDWAADIERCAGKKRVAALRKKGLLLS